MSRAARIALAGLAAGLVSNGLMGVLFTAPPVRSLLYDPALQSALFIEVTSRRDMLESVSGLVLLSIVHAWLFVVFRPALPGAGVLGKGLFWGFTIWLMYWVAQEWFIYRALLREPWALVAVELAILLVGSLAEGVCIALLTRQRLSSGGTSPLAR